MALILHLKYAENLKGKSDRLAKVSFRGMYLPVAIVKKFLNGIKRVLECKFGYNSRVKERQS